MPDTVNSSWVNWTTEDELQFFRHIGQWSKPIAKQIQNGFINRNELIRKYLASVRRRGKWMDTVDVEKIIAVVERELMRNGLRP